MEVEAGRKGWLAATLAEAGEEVPVGQPVAIISDEKPETTVARSVKNGAAKPAAAEVPAKAEAATPAPAKAAHLAKTAAPKPVPTGAGRILALAQGTAAGARAGASTCRGWPRPGIRNPSMSATWEVLARPARPQRRHPHRQSPPPPAASPRAAATGRGRQLQRLGRRGATG